MSASTTAATASPWVPVVAAAVGAGAVLIVGILTQWRTGHREKEQWQREREDRKDQWQREDSLRWVQDRQQAYARLKGAIQSWDDMLRLALMSRADGTSKTYQQLYGPAEVDTAELDRRYTAVNEAHALVELMCPKTVSALAADAVLKRLTCNLHLRRSAQPITDLDTKLSDLNKTVFELRAAMRDDLGMEIGPEDAEG